MLLSHSDIMETINMISQQHLDIRTITMGITLSREDLRQDLPLCPKPGAHRAAH